MLSDISSTLLAILDDMTVPTYFWMIPVLIGGWVSYVVFSWIWKSSWAWYLCRQNQAFIYWKEAQAAMWEYLPRYMLNPSGQTISLVQFFLQDLLTTKEERYYLVLGEEGAGKTTFLLRLIYRFILRNVWSRNAIRYVSISKPGYLQSIQSIKHPERTILIVDGIDETAQAFPDYREHLDELFLHTHKFQKVIFSACKTYFPAEMLGNQQTSRVHYIGERCYETMGKVELPPLTPAQGYKYARKFVNSYSRTSKRKIKQLLTSQAGILKTPGILKLLTDTSLTQAPIRFRSQWVFNYLHQEIGRCTKSVREASLLFEILREVAQEVYIQYQTKGEWRISELFVQHLLEEKEFSPSRLKRCAVVLREQGGYRFSHSLFLSYFLAWHHFHENLPKEETGFLDFPLPRQFFQEMCWEKLINDPASSTSAYRVVGRVEKKPIAAMNQADILFISRLYLAIHSQSDARFLRNLQLLKGVHVVNHKVSNLPIQIIEELPHPAVLLYFAQKDDSFEVYHFQEIEADLWVDESVSMPVQARELKPSRLFDKPDVMDSCSFPGENRPSSQKLLGIFDTDLAQTNLRQESRKLVFIDDSSLSYELIKGNGELDLFDSIQVIELENNRRNFVFTNRTVPTLLIQSLEQVSNQLFQLIGEDDYHQEGFTVDDEAQIEDGHWIGRRWLWENSLSYAHAIHLYMDKPGKVKLCIWDIETKEEVHSKVLV